MIEDPSAHITDAPRLGDEEREPLEEETVDGIPVLDDAHPVAFSERSDAPADPSSSAAGALSPVSSPAVQAAAAAATGFVAGAAALALVRRRGARKLARRAGRPRRAADVLPIIGTRSFLIDVHLIGKDS
jgi:hypothetical protein